MQRLLLSLLILAAPLASQSSSVAIEGGTVHTMIPGQEAKLLNVLIVDGRIEAVGLDLTYPEGTERVDATGMHVTPTLIDGNVHFDLNHDLLYTAHGIGLIRDVGGDHNMLVRRRDDPARMASMAPSMITSGKHIDIDSQASSSSAVVRTLDDCVNTIDVLSKTGVNFITLSHRLPAEFRQKLIELSHAAGLKVWSAVGDNMTLDEALAEGLDGISELNSVRPKSVDWKIVLPPAFMAPARKLAQSKTYLVPMMLAGAVVLQDQRQIASTEEFLRHLSPFYESRWRSELGIRLAQFERSEDAHAMGALIFGKQKKLLKQLHDKGVKLVPGSGSPRPWLFPGIALHQEMAYWESVGIPSADVLAAATRVAAQAFGVEQDFGTLQQGRVGSLLVLAEDPTANLVALRTPQYIVCRGQVLEPEDIDGMYKTVLRRETMAREQLTRRIEIPQPTLPAEAKLILEGRSNTHAMGLPLSSEHFRVGRMPDDSLVFASNIGFPNRENQRRRQTEVYQQLKDGVLEEVRVVVHLEDLPSLIMEGKWVASTWRMQRTQEGKPVGGAISDVRHPSVLQVGSVTTLMVLGQLKLAKPLQVVTFQENLEPVMTTWEMALDDQGNHVVRTHQGATAFRFDKNGAILSARRYIGNELVDFELELSDAFGGEGLLLPAGKQGLIDIKFAEAELYLADERQKQETLATEAAAKAAARPLNEQPTLEQPTTKQD